MTVPGPAELGRGVVVEREGAIPGAWSGAPTVRIDDDVLAAPATAVEVLHRHWAERRPVVIELAVDPGRFRRPDVSEAEPWTLDVGFELWRDRLHFLVWANTYDARKGDPVWWWGRKAARLGAEVGGPADVVLADGVPAWIDGGPRQPLPDDLGVVVHRESVDLGRLAVARHRPPSADLAPDQLEAVAHGGGPARIIAPAGSGKTRVLTERLRHLLADRGVERQIVTAVAYNKRAADEMVARTADVQPHVRTIHSLGLSLLNEQSRRTVLDERQVRRIIDDLVAVQRRANTDPMAPYLEALAEVRLGLRPPEVVEAERDDVPGLAEAFPRYRKALAAAGAVDFDEQVYGAIELLLRDPDARAWARLRCRHLLVDEFQDLTPAFLLLIRLVSAPAFSVFGVGDEDQVIYGYSGADPAFLVDYARWFPGATVHALEVNYRCPPAVVEGARTLLSYNHRRTPKEIRPLEGRPADAGQLRVERHPGARGALDVVALVARWRAEGVDLDDVAVLTRVNSALLPVHVALVEAGVPVRSTLGPEVLQRTGVRAALAYLRLGADTRAMATADLLEVLKRPSRGLSRAVESLLGRRSLWSIGQLRGIKWNRDRDGLRFAELLSDLDAVARAVQGGTTDRALAVVRDQVGLGGAMTLLDSSRGAAEGSTHGDDLDALVQVAALHPDPTSFEPWLRDQLQRPPGERGEGGCTLSTVHRVKGMEWPRVLVFGANAGLMPHRLAADVEEERRIFHVAITRAAEQAVVLADAERPSPFLDELTGVAPRRSPRDQGRGAEAAAATPAAAKRPAAPPVEPAVGLELEVLGGYVGTVAEIDAGGVGLALAAGGRLRVRYGEAVRVAGEPFTLGRPADGDDVEALFEALRAWRSVRAKADGVPAYVVFSDEHLRGIARRRPTSLAELRDCPGVGPTKLDRYGEDLLVAIEDAG